MPRSTERTLPNPVATGTPLEALGSSDEFLDFQQRLARAAKAPRPVLLVGERGTGKELAASRLHYLSPRWGGPSNAHVIARQCTLPRFALLSQVQKTEAAYRGSKPAR